MDLRRLSIVLCVLVGCDDVGSGGAEVDAGVLDAGFDDASVDDAGEEDARVDDAGDPDADTADSGSPPPSCAVDNGGCGEHRECVETSGSPATCGGCLSEHHEDGLGHCVPYACVPSGTDPFEPDDATSPIAMTSEDGSTPSYARTLAAGDVDAFTFTVPANATQTVEWSSDATSADSTAIAYQLVDGEPVEVWSGPFFGDMGVDLGSAQSERSILVVIDAGTTCQTYSISLP